MPLHYPTRYAQRHRELNFPADWDEPEASSSIAPSSSPVLAFELEDWPQVPFGDIPDQPEEDEEDLAYSPSSTLPVERRNDEEKAFAVLQFMRESFPRFSLRLLLKTLLVSGSRGIKNTVNTWQGNGGITELLDLLWARTGLSDEAICEWVVQKASTVCAREASFLTDRAAEGPYKAQASALRVPAQSVSVARLESFSLRGLHAMYAETMPCTQAILTAIINQDEKDRDAHSRNPGDVRTSILSGVGALILSIALVGVYADNLYLAQPAKPENKPSPSHHQSTTLGQPRTETLDTATQSRRCIFVVRSPVHLDPCPLKKCSLPRTRPREGPKANDHAPVR